MMSNDPKETVVDWSKLGYELLNKTDSDSDCNYRYFISYVGQNGRKKNDICNAIIATQDCLDDELKIREAERELAHYSKYKRVVFLNIQELKRH